MTETKVTHDCGAVRWLGCPEFLCDGGILEDGTRDVQCPPCDGTGLRFPGLSRECSFRYLHSLEGKGQHCVKCQGRERVPVDSLEAWLDALFSVKALGAYVVQSHKKPYLLDLQWAVCKLVGAHEEESDAT